jgi:hypothetical protein
MKFGVIFDCEFLTAEGAPSRFWNGPLDPDPVVAQIGIVKIGLEEDFPLAERLRLYVVPRTRQGLRCPLDPLFVRLTGIDEQTIDEKGVTLATALKQVADFACGSRLWSWGKDEFNMVAISCYVEGVEPPIPIRQFGNACDLLLKAGMPYEDLKRTRSNTLSGYYDLEHEPLRGHDALDDALSVAYALQHLLRKGALQASDFQS